MTLTVRRLPSTTLPLTHATISGQTIKERQEMLIGVFLDIAPTGRLNKPDLTQAYLDPAVGTLFTQMLEESGGASSFRSSLFPLTFQAPFVTLENLEDRIAEAQKDFEKVAGPNLIHVSNQEMMRAPSSSQMVWNALSSFA